MCQVESVKGFINFTLAKSFLQKMVDEALTLGLNYAKGENKNEKILLEYVSANPTGPLHIGHARGAIAGDTIARVGRHLGFDITTEYYINDAGAQMDLLGLSISLAAREYLLNETVEYPENYYRGDYLIDIAKQIQETHGNDIFNYRGDYLIDIAKQIQETHGNDIFNDESKFKEMALFGKDEVMKIIIKDLGDLGIEFENFVSEKSLYYVWDETKKVLEDNNSLYEKEGKVYLRSTQFGDDSDRVVVRDNGIPTYLAGDIIYHKDKYDRNYDKYINIWGADHHGYITRVIS